MIEVTIERLEGFRHVHLREVDQNDFQDLQGVFVLQDLLQRRKRPGFFQFAQSIDRAPSHIRRFVPKQATEMQRGILNRAAPHGRHGRASHIGVGGQQTVLDERRRLFRANIRWQILKMLQGEEQFVSPGVFGNDLAGADRR